MKKIILPAAILILVIFFTACTKTEKFTTDSIEDFYPLKVGKYVTYRLDSLIFANNIVPFDTTYSYQVKHLVQDTTTDNLGRKAFIIRRYIRKTAADMWMADNTFTAVNTGKALEFTDNNLRFLKLEEPIKNGFTWKGNSYFDTQSSYSELQYFDDWDYVYDSLNTPLKLGNINVDSTVKVFERDQTDGNTADKTTYSEINFSVSNYGRGIGLVYHRFLHQVYQPPTPGTSGYKEGYGLTLTMIDHN